MANSRASSSVKRDQPSSSISVDGENTEDKEESEDDSDLDGCFGLFD